MSQTGQRATVDFIRRHLPLIPHQQIARHANFLARMVNAERNRSVRDLLADLHDNLVANIAAYCDALHEGVVPLVRIQDRVSQPDHVVG